LKLRSASQVLVVALCVLALFVAQTLGGKVAYYCLCGGKPVPTQTTHCHGPHGAKCHETEAQNGGSHSEEGSGERKDHQAVSQDVQLRPVEAAPQVIAPQVLLAILPLVAILYSNQELRIPANYDVDFGESPPFGVTVARTIVLLI
jgi:hypothetical protein